MPSTEPSAVAAREDFARRLAAVQRRMPRHLAEPIPAAYVTVRVAQEDAHMLAELLARESTARSERARNEGHPGVRRSLEHQAGALLAIACQLSRGGRG